MHGKQQQKKQRRESVVFLSTRGEKIDDGREDRWGEKIDDGEMIDDAFRDIVNNL